ncbi:MAG: hypothetical protein WEC79_06555 [Thermomicrobiales bacterium]
MTVDAVPLAGPTVATDLTSLDFQHQHAPLGMDDDEVRLALNRAVLPAFQQPLDAGEDGVVVVKLPFESGEQVIFGVARQSFGESFRIHLRHASPLAPSVARTASAPAHSRGSRG